MRRSVVEKLSLNSAENGVFKSVDKSIQMGKLDKADMSSSLYADLSRHVITVDTLADRDAIPFSERSEGMVVKVKADPAAFSNGRYVLEANLTTWRNSFTLGTSTVATGSNSMAAGMFTEALGMNSFAGGLGFGATGTVKASGTASFNFSQTTYTPNMGAAADNSAILGGMNNQIYPSALRSVVLGGSGITATEPDTVYVKHLVVGGDGKDAYGNDLGLGLFETVPEAASPLLNMLFVIKDEAFSDENAEKIGANGIYEPWDFYKSTEYNWWFFQDPNILDIAQMQSYNSAYAGKTVYINLGDYLYPAEFLGEPLIYDDLYNENTQKLDIMRSQLMRELVDPQKQHWMYLIDGYSTNRVYPFNETMTVTRLPSTYDEAYVGQVVYFMDWGRFSTKENDVGWILESDNSWTSTAPFPLKHYEDFYENGVLAPKKDQATNYNYYIFHSWPGNFDLNVLTYHMMPSYASLRVNSTLATREVTGVVKENTLYTNDINVQGSLYLNGAEVAGGRGLGKQSWVQSTDVTSGLDASGDYSFASGYSTKAYAKASFIHTYRSESNDWNHGMVRSDMSAVLGGENGGVTWGAERSVVLGGKGIVATAPDTVYVPSLVVHGSVQNKEGSVIGGMLGVANDMISNPWNLLFFKLPQTQEPNPAAFNTGLGYYGTIDAAASHLFYNINDMEAEAYVYFSGRYYPSARLGYKTVLKDIISLGIVNISKSPFYKEIHSKTTPNLLYISNGATLDTHADTEEIEWILLHEYYNFGYDGKTVYTIKDGNFENGAALGYATVNYENMYVDNRLDTTKHPLLVSMTAPGLYRSYSMEKVNFDRKLNFTEPGFYTSTIGKNTYLTVEDSKIVAKELKVASKTYYLTYKSDLNNIPTEDRSEGMVAYVKNDANYNNGRYVLASDLVTWNTTFLSGIGMKVSGSNAFAHSRSTTYYNPTGASAPDSALLGGVDNNIQSYAERSVVIGGKNINATQPDTVYVPNLQTTGYINGAFTPSRVTIVNDVPQTEVDKLVNTANWDATGQYIGTPIVNTFAGQKLRTTTHFFMADEDNVWVRWARG
jgi:hypothetical protein